jgi:hypothetical protein
VLSVLAISACLALKLSSLPQPVAMSGVTISGTGSAEYNFGMQSMPTTVTLAFVPAGSADDYTVSGVAVVPGSDCGEFGLAETGGGIGPATNSGTAHVYFSDTACDGITPGLPGGGTASGGSKQCPYMFNATFAPTMSKPVECEYAFTFTPFGGSPMSFFLYLDASGANVDGVTANPTSLGLTAPTNMQSAPGSITVTNIGSGTVMVMPSVGDARFTYNPGIVTLSGMGSNQVYTVKCGDSAPSTFMSTLMFAATPGTGSATQLTCTVYDPTGLMFSGDYHFPVTLVGSASVDQTVNASYSGSAMPLMMSITAPNVTGVGAGWTGTMWNGCIGAGACPNGTSFPVTLHWVPTAQVNGQLGFLNGKLGSGGNVPVAINGDAEYANVVSNPTGVDAGAICAGNAAKAQSLDIYNAGLAPVTLNSVSVTNVSPAGTTVTLNPQPLPNSRLLESHGNDVMTSVTVTPPASASGQVGATLHLTLADVTTPTLDVAVTANAIAAASGVTATPNMLSFPTIAVGATSSPQQFVLTNCGASALTILAHPITDKTTNTDSPDFAITEPPDPLAPIPPAGSMTFTIAMTPSSSGTKMAQLSLVHGDGTSTPVDLVGTGYIDNGSGGGQKKDRKTYYACDAGRPEGFAPIALALLALRRRRK